MALGWIAFALLCVVTAVEHHPRAEGFIAKAIASRVSGPLGENVAIEDVDVLWLRRSVSLRGLRMGTSREEGDPGNDFLVLDEVRLRLGWKPSGGVTFDRVEVDGGSVVIDESLSPDVGGSARDGGSAVDLLAQSPEVALRSIELALALPEGRTLELGTADLSLTQQGVSGQEAARAAPGDTEQGTGTTITGRFSPAIRLNEPGAAAFEAGDGQRTSGQGDIWLSGTLDEYGIARVQGVARALALSMDPVIGPDEDLLGLGMLRRWDPRGRVNLAAEAVYEVGRSVLPAVTLSLQVSDGRARLPWLDRAESRPLEGVDLLAELAFDPTAGEHALDPAAWSALGQLRAQWEELEGSFGFRAGTHAPDGYSLDVWGDVPEAPLGQRLAELAAGEPSIVELREMLAPEGHADVTLGVRLPRKRDPAKPIARSLEKLVFIRARGDADLAYHGGIDRRTGERNVGFPLPVRNIVGDVTWSIRRSQADYPGQLGFYDLRGAHSAGPVDVRGSLHFKPKPRPPKGTLRAPDRSPFHLVVHSQELPLNGDFDTAMSGLFGVPEVAELIPTWNPGGGQLGLRLELWRAKGNTALSVDLEAELDGVGFRWEELPIPITDSRGTIRITTDGAGPRDGHALVQLDLEARSTISAEPLSIQGRVAAQGAEDGLPESLLWFDLQGRRLNLRAEDLRAEVARKNPEAGAALDAAGVGGFVDLSLCAVRGLPALKAQALRSAATVLDPETGPYVGGLQVWSEARPRVANGRGVQIQPKDFRIPTRRVQGRVLATTLAPPEPRRGQPVALDGLRAPWTEFAAAIQGEWKQAGPAVAVAARVTARGDRPARLRVMGAGLDIASPLTMGVLIETASLAAEDDGGMDPVDTNSIDVAGRVDFNAEFTLPEAPGLPITEQVVGLEARLRKLGFGGSQILRDVSAHVRFDPDSEQWIGEEVDARLGGTDIRLSGLVFESEPGFSRLSARLSAEDLPIDREHLSFFLDEETMRTVLDDLKARGTFDLQRAALTVTEHRDGTREVELAGKLRVEDAFVDLGAPVEISLVESMDLHLNHEGTALRARATVEGLFGAIAGRRLERARLQMTYVGKRLVIEAFDGGFEGGRLRAKGSDMAAGADLFTIDLKAPFPFRLAANMTDVDIGEFLRGVFDSNFANRGIMDLSMTLAGDFEELIDMRGGGVIQVRDSALWAIPVFQALSQSLGIDTTVLFKTMRCNYSIQDGSLFIDGMRVDSDLLSLVGRGSITFEGDVTSDLEVRYSLVDGLGPLTRLLYWIQNSLLRVSIRGTMDRPTVVLRGLISRFFAPSEERDRLPLPGFSQRPRRF